MKVQWNNTHHTYTIEKYGEKSVDLSKEESNLLHSLEAEFKKRNLIYDIQLKLDYPNAPTP